MVVKLVVGKKVVPVMLYDLSTCVWCNKTKKLLGELGIEYSYEDVDLLDGKDREQTIKIVKKWNPLCSFPTLLIDNKICIVGFKEEEIRKALQL